MREIEEIVDLLLCENTFELGCKILKEDFGCNFYRNPEDIDDMLADRDINKGLYSLPLEYNGLTFLFIDNKDWTLLYKIKERIDYKVSLFPHTINTPRTPFKLT